MVDWYGIVTEGRWDISPRCGASGIDSCATLAPRFDELKNLAPRFDIKIVEMEFH
jgi:hypothetical protein